MIEINELSHLSETEAEAIGAALAAAVRPVAPASGALAKLLSAVANPWARALGRFAALVDLPTELAARLLDRAQAGLGWVPGPLPGVSLVHLDGGPATTGADVGIVRIPPDGEFPPHAHLGAESIVLLEGEYVDSAGYVLRAGDVETREPGAPHAFHAGPHGVVFAVVLREGIAVEDPAGGPPIVVKG